MTSESRKRKRNRLGQCDVCRSKDAIYTCPRCETVSCGLDCVKRHKKELDCDGVRIRSKYIPRDSLDEHSLLSDYRLLEDIRRCVDTAERYTEVLDTFQQPVADLLPTKIIGKEELDRDVQKPDTKDATKIKTRPENQNNAKVKPQQQKPQRITNRSVKNKANAVVVDKNVKIPTKKDLLLAKSKRIREKTLRNSKKGKDALLASDKSISKSLNPNLKCSKESMEVANSGMWEGDPQNRPVFSNEENLKASSQLKETLRNILKSTTTPPDAVKQETDESEVLKNASQSVASSQVPSSSTTASSSEAGKGNNKAALHAKLKNRILTNIRQGGRRKEKAFETLQKAALTRGVVLNALPEHFHRHWENTSFFFARENLIYWHIKVAFINASCYTLTLSECSESMTLESLIKRCFKRSQNFHRKQSLNNPLNTYMNLGVSNLSVLMVADRLPNSQKKFYVLDLKKSLKENFEGKCIIEYPQLCVALEDCYAVSTMQETATHNFFAALEDENASADFKSAETEFDKILRKKEEKRKSKNKGKIRRTEAGSGRESGELTDSSDNDSFFDTDSDCDESDEELFRESEFRSIYKDLLSTFDSDVNKK